MMLHRFTCRSAFAETGSQGEAHEATDGVKANLDSAAEEGTAHPTRLGAAGQSAQAGPGSGTLGIAAGK